jgi:hypothetical protein
VNEIVVTQQFCAYAQAENGKTFFVDPVSVGGRAHDGIKGCARLNASRI